MCVCLCDVLLIEVGLGDGEEGAVSVSSDAEDEGLPGENGQVSHHLPWVGHEQQAVLLTVNHALINVEEPGDDECHAHILKNHERDV